MIKIPEKIYKKILKLLPIVCVDLIIINKRKEYLLIKRNNTPLKNCWWVPGGRLLKGEKLENAIKRIANKELGIKLNNKQFHMVHQGFYKNVHSISIIYKCFYNGNNIKLDYQSSDWKWSKKLPKQLMVIND